MNSLFNKHCLKLVLFTSILFILSLHCDFIAHTYIIGVFSVFLFNVKGEQYPRAGLFSVSSFGERHYVRLMLDYTIHTPLIL